MALVTTPEMFPTSEMFGDTVIIKVGAGDTAKTFDIHKGVLSFYSGYFAAALNEDTFIEGKENFISLPTEDIRVFADFVLWLYTRQTPVEQQARAAYDCIVALWVFADRRQVPLLANTMINELRDKMIQFWHRPTKQLNYVYERTAADAGLRRLMILLIGSTCSAEHLAASERSRWNEDALWDLATFLWTRKSLEVMSKERVAAIDLCEYHTHEEGARCPKP